MPTDTEPQSEVACERIRTRLSLYFARADTPSQRSFATSSAVDLSVLNRIVKGHITPTIKVVGRICDELGISISDLTGKKLPTILKNGRKRA
jgi:transcriptional regulator with XRE-family HTH domain